MTRETIKVLWLDKTSIIDTEYATAAFKLADHVATARLDGTPEAVYLVEFQCAVHKRNALLGVVASELLKEAGPEVTTSEVYQQYAEGLISSTECCNALSV